MALEMGTEPALNGRRSEAVLRVIQRVLPSMALGMLHPMLRIRHAIRDVFNVVQVSISGNRNSVRSSQTAASGCGASGCRCFERGGEVGARDRDDARGRGACLPVARDAFPDLSGRADCREGVEEPVRDALLGFVE